VKPADLDRGLTLDDVLDDKTFDLPPPREVIPKPPTRKELRAERRRLVGERVRVLRAAGRLRTRGAP
jgi:hypothetical protein